MQKNGTTGLPRRAGFSLIELLVVIAILVILIALTIAVATGINNSSRNRAAADTIRVLDQSVEAWIGATGGRVPSSYTYTDTSNNSVTVDAFDGRLDSVADFAAEPLPSLGVYAQAIQANEDVSSVITAIDTSWRSIVSYSSTLDLTQVVDPWGRPIRFVHPAFQGGSGDYWTGTSLNTARDPVQVRLLDGSPGDARRSWKPFTPSPTQPPDWVGDADEGICPGGGTRPYFYSAGASGDPGNTKDNIYSERPQFPNETDPVRVRRE